ncbi:cytochrome P450 [Saccharata proteae CBS 121410]|uniref:Cytochrome P450 n=1 Tax=Saccharata proteae CBS 121410 TaxID=1314787 RepID=A0A9P4HZY2_9PEZI|nr:cytochrome P450 [Saccharata proteae CBS 121410]
MLSEAVIFVTSTGYSLLIEQTSGFLSRPFVVLTVLFVVWYIWRLWRFTISPLLNPEKPLDAPYLVPFLGHTVGFLNNADRIIEAGLNTFGRSREPFAIRLVGERIYIITSPEDAATSAKNATTFSWDSYLKRLLMGFGVTGDALDLAWHTPQPGETCYMRDNPFNPQQKNLIHLTEDIYKRQLLPGEELDKLTMSFISLIDYSLIWERLSGNYVRASSPTYKQISLKLFSRRIMTEAVTKAMFGDVLFDLEPELVDYLMTLNKNAWAVAFGCPKIFTPKLNHAIAKLSAALETYMELPEEKRDGICWLIDTMLKAQKITGIDQKDRVSMTLMVWWAALSNAVDMAFWIMSYLLFDGNLLETVKEETAPAFDKHGNLHHKYLLEDCPRFESIFLEVLRLVNGALTVRKILATTRIGTKVLEAGNTVIIPARQLHLNEEVWGANNYNFDPERFLKDPKLAGHNSYRPFGGGVTYCPGRFLARSEICGFTAMILKRFEVGLATLPNGSPQEFPKLDISRPSIGVTGCVEGMDVLINVKPAKDDV